MKSVDQLFRYLQNLLKSARSGRQTRARRPLDSVEAVEPRMLLTTTQNALFDAVILNELQPNQEIDSWFVRFDEAQDTDRLAQVFGATSVTESTLIPNGYLLELADGLTVDEAANQFSGEESFDYLYPNIERTFFTRSAPNDPLFPAQWHLQNTGQGGGLAGADANIVDVYDDFTGEGVTIAVVDDGLDVVHEDLAGNVNTEIDFDFNFNDDDPSPTGTDSHGTSVAGVAAAVGNNGIGVAGAAYDAELVGIRLIAAGFTDATGGTALNHELNNIDIYNNSWGPPDDGTLHSIGPLQRAALERGATVGRNGLGNIHVWAAGNGGDITNDNVNYDPFANSRFTLAVGALTNSGVRAFYSDVGASLIVSAYSNGGSLAITTADATGTAGETPTNYTDQFGGTSSAAPLVAGVIALMLEANPNLTYRDVTDIIVRNAERVDPNNPDWVQNGAGLWVNHEFGFGGVDAEAFVNAALNHVNLAEEQTYSTGLQAVNTDLAEGVTVERTVTVPQSENLSLEYVEVVLNADHTHAGDLEVVLISPDGTESILAETRTDATQGYNGFTLTSARHWGEISAGEWTIRVTDNGGGGTGSFDSFQLNLYGTDPAVLSVVESAGSTVVSDFQGVDELSISLPVQPSSDVVIDIVNPDATEVELSTSRLVFTPENFSTQQTVTLSGVLDLVADGPQRTNVTFSVNQDLSDDLYDGAAPVTISVTSLDDDRDIPLQPTLTSPDQFPDSSSPVFVWNPGERSETFTLEVTDVLTGVLLQRASGIRATTFAFALPFPDGLYSAVVTPFNSLGQQGIVSEPLVFNVGEPVVPAAPLITAPANGQTQASSFPTIQWTSVPGAVEYEIFIGSPGGSQRITTTGTDIGGGQLSFTPSTPLPEGSTAIWIRGVNFFGTAGEWSPPVRFVVDSFDLPGVPRLTAPLLSVIADPFPTFEWTGVQNAATYQLWVEELREGTGTAQVQAVYDRVINVTNTIETSYEHFRPLSERPHRVWVRAFNSAGETSGWGTPVSFEVDVPDPATPVLTIDAETQDLTPTFTWSTAGQSAGTTYRLWVNNLTTGQNRVIDVSGIEGGSFTPTEPLDQGRLAVWVQATTANGVVSEWSPRVVINLDVPTPPQPVITSPIVQQDSNATAVESEFPVWEWEAVPDAVRYELWVNHVESGTVRLIHRTDLTETTFVDDEPILEGTLRAWVRAFNAADEASDWSPVFVVSVDVPVPSQPTVNSPTPSPSGSVEDSSPVITWSITDPGITYDLQIRDVGTGEVVIEASGITELSYEVQQQLAERRFEVRVRGRNSVDEPGEWSDWFAFRIDIPNATTPTAIGPIGTVTSNEVNFVWTHAPDSVRYEILVQDLRDRETTILNVSTFNITGQNASFESNLPDGTYRFWIRAFNDQDTASGWSNPQSFTVENRVASLDANDDFDTELVSLDISDRLRQHRAEAAVEAADAVIEEADAVNLRASVPTALPVVTATPESTDVGVEEQLVQRFMAELAESTDTVVL